MSEKKDTFIVYRGFDRKIGEKQTLRIIISL
jgi:hypothetical protein